MTRIVLRAFGDENYYLRDLPIHKSQREIGSGDGYTDFMIELRPNKELIAYLLSRRERLKVLSPDSIVEEMKAGIDKMKANY
jgi:predicted DNA-binding transcriptional regulator YafY